jgi:hypothetical protein
MINLLAFLPLFITAVFLAFYIPGRVVLGEQKSLSKIGIFSVSFILGIVLWGWQAYLFGFLQLRWLSYIYLLIFLVIFVRKKYFSFKLPKIQFKKPDWITGLIVLIGIIGQAMPFVKNGLMSSSGIFISSYNSTDHIWHATLVEELVRRFPPHEPGMYGILLTNYHFWFHLVTADLVRVFNLPLFQTQFGGIYVMSSVLLAMIACVFAKTIYDSKLFLRLFLFFIFFSGNAGNWFMLLLKNDFSLHVDWLFEDATKFMDAPGMGVATIIAFAGSYLLFKFRNKMSWRLTGIVGLLFGSLVGFKIYIGIPFIFGLFVFAVVNGLRKDFSILWAFMIACVLSLIQFLPFNLNSGGLFFLPVDIPRDFLSQKVLGLGFVDQRWKIYLAHGNYFRLIEYGVIMTTIYLLVQFGVKLFGLLPLRKTIHVLGKSFYIFLNSIVFSSLILGLFFYQRVGGANIWEFFLAVSPVLAIITALNICLYLPKSRILMCLIIFAIITFTIPTWLISVNNYLKLDYLSGFHGISNSELDSYTYLRNNTSADSNILFIDNKTNYPASSLVSIFTRRNLFLSGTGVSQIMTPQITKRIKDVGAIKTSLDQQKVGSILEENRVNYIYVDNSFILPASTTSANLREFFSNKSAKIFKVD